MCPSWAHPAVHGYVTLLWWYQGQLCKNCVLQLGPQQVDLHHADDVVEEKLLEGSKLEGDGSVEDSCGCSSLPFHAHTRDLPMTAVNGSERPRECVRRLVGYC